MSRTGNANVGFIAHLTDNAEAIVAAGKAVKPNPWASAAILVLIGANVVAQVGPERIWPPSVALFAIGTGLAVKARREADPDQLAARLWFWAVFVGSVALLVGSRALGGN
ncbi:MAG: hypothetical protein QOD86_1694 [Miltoncostaeaceae bacterium]|nr:hypothetical protein [Miltoncostaeaceae bacterium]